MKVLLKAMAEKKQIEAGKILKKLLERRGIEVHKIVIFGSYAKGKEKKESDIDIIIVSKDFENQDIFGRVEITSGIHRELVEEIMIPVDIMYYSVKEWEKGSSLTINAAKQQGEIVYSRWNRDYLRLKKT